MTETALAGQSATVSEGTLTARMQAAAKALDDSGEELGAVLAAFIANALDLSEVGRVIAAEGDELRAASGQPPRVPPQDVRDRLGDFFTVMGLDDPRGLASKLLAAVPGEAFGPKETTRRRLTQALASMTVEVRPRLADMTGAETSSGQITDPAWVADVLAGALGNLGTLPESVTAEISRITTEKQRALADAFKEIEDLRAELKRVAAEKEQAVDALNQLYAGAP